MDNELHELCKQVYEKTGWGDTDFTYWGWFDSYPDVVLTSEVNEKFTRKEDYRVPLYTSDYLLEKLPPVIFVHTSDGTNSTAILTVWINGDKTVHVAYMIPFDEQNRGDYAKASDTPLKALLKLTLALKEAGEL